MITNFEKITTDLTNEDLVLLPHLIQGFKLHSPSNPIKANDIVQSFNKYIEREGIKARKITEARLRKFVNHIRSRGLLPLVATSSGYYTTNNEKEISHQIKSLRERARSILTAAEGLEYYLTTNKI